MITDVEFSLKKEWVKKLKLILLEINLKDTYSESMEDSIKTDFQWSKVFFVTTELDSYFHQEHQDIELKEKDKEREDQSEDA
jgi:hypothetical protein